MHTYIDEALLVALLVVKQVDLLNPSGFPLLMKSEDDNKSSSLKAKLIYIVSFFFQPDEDDSASELYYSGQFRSPLLSME